MSGKWFYFLLALLVTSSGCSSGSVETLEGGAGPSAYPSVPAVSNIESRSMFPSPYPPSNEQGEEIKTPKTAPYPGIESVRENVTPQSTAETPFLLVDITIQPTNPDEFVMASGGYQLVEFFAFWCPTCKSMTPVLRKLESKYAGKIRFTYLDIDDPKTNPIKQALGYQFQPHLFLVDPEGNVIKQWIGYVAEEELDAVLGSLP